MFKTSRTIIISLAAVYMSACSIDGTSRNYNFTNSQMLYPDSYDSYNYQFQENGYPETAPPRSSGEVKVPDSYHVGSGRPTSAKDMDKNWVKNQNPSAYTIELANDDKPSTVAGVLYKAPKNERSAEVRTNNGSYTGVYGSYPSYEAAQEKLKSLPENVRQKAQVKSWSNVQSSVE